MKFTVSLTHHDWSLHRKGPIDQARHTEKIKEAVRENLANIVSQESIITSDGQKIVRIPIRSLDLPRFRFDDRKSDQVGQGNGDSQVGDVLGREPGQGQQGPGRGKQAGDQPGVDFIEAAVDIDDLAALIFEDLGLPNLKHKGTETLETENVVFRDIRRSGSLSNMDKRRTVLQNLKRNAMLGKPGYGGITNDDIRYKTWEIERRREASAVVIAMRDVSGSMGEFEKYISRSFYFWMVRFLRTRYANVKIVFITHHTEAKEVDEETFFKLGESGGTRVSSAYQLALDVIKQRFDPRQWNIYPFHFSDGDNWGDEDNKRCLALVRQMMDLCNIFGYGEIRSRNYSTVSTLMSAFGDITDERFIGLTIGDKKEVYPALKRFFNGRMGEAA